jgi:hypothetical protein
MRSRESDHPYVHSPHPDGPFNVLRQIAFASAARPGLKPADTSAIIAASRANNVREGITGVLVYSGESFLQLVEGPDDALAVLWRRLILDDRHRSLASIYGAETGDRWFADWRAGYVSEANLAPQIFRWRTFAPALPRPEVERLRAFLSEAQAF